MALRGRYPLQKLYMNGKTLQQIQAIQINKAKEFYKSRPFVTSLYVSMKTGIPIDFIKKHWKQITS